MLSSRNAFFSLVLSTLVIVVICRPPYPAYRPSPHIPQYDGTTYRGWATYYGTPPMPGNNRVHCHLPNIGSNGYGPHVVKTIAMNGDQWANSGVCGMCVEVWGSGKLCKHGQQRNDCGMGRARYAPRKKFIAVVTDELGERQFGDIDIGEYGDGHYPVSWKPVVCPWNSHWNSGIVLHAGSNPYYLKIQLRFGDSPMQKAYYVPPRGAWEQSHWHDDNFFIFRRFGGNGFKFDSNGQMQFRFITILGKNYCGKIDRKLYAEPHLYSAWRC